MHRQILRNGPQIKLRYLGKWFAGIHLCGALNMFGVLTGSTNFGYYVKNSDD